jgi:hypothetical protein
VLGKELGAILGKALSFPREEAHKFMIDPETMIPSLKEIFQENRSEISILGS